MEGSRGEGNVLLSAVLSMGWSAMARFAKGMAGDWLLGLGMQGQGELVCARASQEGPREERILVREWVLFYRILKARKPLDANDLNWLVGI